MTDAVVIGGGIVGAACAAALTQDGLRVTIVEDADAGATGAGMGHLVVMDDSEPQFALTHYSRDLWIQLAPALPAEAEFERRGTIWVAADEAEMAAVRAKAAYYTSRGVRAEILDARALAEAEPNLRAGLAGGLLVPDDAVIYAPCAARWLAADRHTGTVVKVLDDGGVLLADGTRIPAGIVVCAAGTRTPELIPGVAVRPRKGHLAITDRYPDFMHHQLVELGYLQSAHGAALESVAFNVQPRATGQVLIGSSRQFDETSPAVDSGILRRMLRRACSYVPALEALSVIRVWTGFRAATEDNLPIIGPCPGRENVFLATGHEGLGITASLGTARLIADMVAGREPAIDAAPYLPLRAVHA